MNRSYVKEYVVTASEKNDVYFTSQEVDAIIDSVLFDWNELGCEGDFEDLVNWNVEQYLAHTYEDERLKKIDFKDIRNFIPYPKEWFDISYKPKPKYFLLRKLESGWDKVYYFLDRKKNEKKYSNKLLE